MFHDIIKKIPVRDYGLDGLEVHVAHTSTGTVYFVSGSCTFTANGESKIYTAGDYVDARTTEKLSAATTSENFLAVGVARR